jgi:hypothetical protein
VREARAPPTITWSTWFGDTVTCAVASAPNAPKAFGFATLAGAPPGPPIAAIVTEVTPAGTVNDWGMIVFGAAGGGSKATSKVWLPASALAGAMPAAANTTAPTSVRRTRRREPLDGPGIGLS